MSGRLGFPAAFIPDRYENTHFSKFISGFGLRYSPSAVVSSEKTRSVFIMLAAINWKKQSFAVAAFRSAVVPVDSFTATAVFSSGNEPYSDSNSNRANPHCRALWTANRCNAKTACASSGEGGVTARLRAVFVFAGAESVSGEDKND